LVKKHSYNQNKEDEKTSSNVSQNIYVFLFRVI